MHSAKMKIVKSVFVALMFLAVSSDVYISIGLQFLEMLKKFMIFLSK